MLNCPCFFRAKADNLPPYVAETKGRFRATIFKSAETVPLIFLRYLGDAIRCIVSADLKIVACSRPLAETIMKAQSKVCQFSYEIQIHYERFFASFISGRWCKKKCVDSSHPEKGFPCGLLSVIRSWHEKNFLAITFNLDSVFFLPVL